jgi:hypothetical protein
MNSYKEQKPDSVLTTIFFFKIYEWDKQARVFAPGRPFRPSFVFVGKESEAPKGWFTWVGSGLTRKQ